MEDCMELLPQEHVFKPERPLIAQMLTAKVGSKFRGESRESRVKWCLRQPFCKPLYLTSLPPYHQGGMSSTATKGSTAMVHAIPCMTPLVLHTYYSCSRILAQAHKGWLQNKRTPYTSGTQTEDWCRGSQRRIPPSVPCYVRVMLIVCTYVV